MSAPFGPSTKLGSTTAKIFLNKKTRKKNEVQWNIGDDSEGHTTSYELHGYGTRVLRLFSSKSKVTINRFPCLHLLGSLLLALLTQTIKNALYEFQKIVYWTDSKVHCNHQTTNVGKDKFCRSASGKVASKGLRHHKTDITDITNLMMKYSN